MLVPDAIKAEMYNHNIIRSGHFKLTSGVHSDTYVHKDAIFPCSPGLLQSIMIEFEHLSYCGRYPPQYNLVTGPAVAGAILAGIFAFKERKPFVYPEKGERIENVGEEGRVNVRAEDVMLFRRGFDKAVKGKKLLLVEDIITTGGSVLKTIEAIEQCGGEVEQVIAVWNRTRWQYAGIPVSAIINDTVDHWEELRHGNCPMCAEGIPLMDPKTMKVI